MKSFSLRLNVKWYMLYYNFGEQFHLHVFITWHHRGDPQAENPENDHVNRVPLEAPELWLCIQGDQKGPAAGLYIRYGSHSGIISWGEKWRGSMCMTICLIYATTALLLKFCWFLWCKYFLRSKFSATVFCSDKGIFFIWL